MRTLTSATILSLVALVGGCAYPASNPAQSGQPNYSPLAYEQPQRVDFFYGSIIDVRPVQVHLRNGGYSAVGIAPGLPLPVMIGGSYQQGPGSSLNVATIGPVNVFAEAAVSDAPAVEYTVIPDRKTYPPDPFLAPTQSPAIVVVQNRYATDLPLAVGDRAFVRVVGNTAHVMRADTIPPSVERIVSAGPIPIPIPMGPAPPICDTAGVRSGECAP